MLRPQPYIAPGYVRDGYVEDWSPLYVRDGYVAPGYIATQPRHVNHPLMSFDLRRLPGYPEYTIEFNQWSAQAGGGAIFAGEPYAVRIYQSLSWDAICTADRDNWESLFLAARGPSDSWVWWNPVNGNAMRVCFADAAFPASPEVGYGYHRLQGLRLMHDINYPGMPAFGTPWYSAAMGTALGIGGVLVLLPAPVRPNTGHGLELRYVREDSSAGLPVVVRTGNVTRRQWTLSWTSLRYIHWIRLQAFFCPYVRGMKQPFTWYDTDGTARTVRLASPAITVKQVGYDRFTCDLAVTEDL